MNKSVQEIKTATEQAIEQLTMTLRTLDTREFNVLQERVVNTGITEQRNWLTALNTIDQYYNRMETTVTSTDKKEGEDHDPTFESVVSIRINGLVIKSGPHKAKKKKEARAKAAKEIFSGLQPFFEHELNKISNSGWIKDLLRENIEANPGPTIRFPKLGLRVYEEGDKLFVVTTNNTKIQITKGQGQWSDNHFELELSHDICKRLTECERNGRETLIATKIEPNIRKYSNHIDFEPTKRIIIKPDNDFFSEAGHNYPVTDSEGYLRKCSNFQFIPRNLIKIKIGTNLCSFKDISTAKYRYVMTSVTEQEMTEDQLIEYASLATTIQMYTVRFENTYADLISGFYKLFLNNVKTLKKQRGLMISDEQAWEMLASYDVFIPTAPIFFGKAIEILKGKFPTPEKVHSFELIPLLLETKPSYVYEGKTKEQILDAYIKGLTLSTDAELAMFKFDFKQSTNQIPNTLRTETETLTENEKFLKALVIRRLFQPDFEVAVVEALEHSDLPFVIDMIKVMSSKIWTSAVHATLHKMLKKDLGETIGKSDDPDHEITYVNYKQEFLVARRMQLEFNIFAEELKFPSKANVFNTHGAVRMIWTYRNTKCIQVNETYYQSAVRMYGSLKEVLNNVFDSSNSLKEINSLWADKKHDITKLFGITENSKLGTSLLTTCDFSSFASSITSIKVTVNSLFDSLMGSLMAMVGINYDHTVDVTTATLYYLVWKNSTCETLKYLLILDILTSLGILDIGLNILRAIGGAIYTFGAKMIGKIVSVNDFEDALLDDILQHRKSVNEKIYVKAKEVLKDTEPEDTHTENMTIFERLTTIIDDANPYLYGAIAAAIALFFKIPKKFDYNIVGASLIGTMKNFSILAGGLVAIPKILQFAIAAFKWIIDELKGLVMSKHVTKAKLNMNAMQWIKDIAPFMNDQFTVLLPRYPTMTMRYLELDNIRQEIEKEPMKLERDTRIAFDKYSKKFAERKTTIVSAIENMFGLDEIFHVQFASAPGLGKTDLANAVIRELSEEWNKIEQDRSGTFDGALEKVLLGNALLDAYKAPSRYAYNESLKYMDGFDNQLVLVNDDANIFKEVDPETATRFIQLVSGQPVVANMAHLEDKGRVITSKIMVSNTNNPYPENEGMLDKNAMNRRRRLVVVYQSAKFMKFVDEHNLKDLPLNDKITAFYDATGTPRTSSEHLTFDVNQPTVAKPLIIQHGDKMVEMKNLNMTQIKKYLRSELRLHFAKEWLRASENDPIMLRLRTYFKALNTSNATMLSADELMAKADEMAKQYFHKHTMPGIEKYVQTLKTLTKPEDVAAEKKRLKQMFKNQNDFDSNYIKNFRRGITIDVASLFTKIETVSLKTVNKKLIPVPEGTSEKQLYKLVDCVEETAYDEGEIDWTKVTIKDKVLYYESVGDLSEIQYRCVLGALASIDACSGFYKETALKKKVKKFVNEPFCVGFYESMKNHLLHAAELGTSYSKWIYKNIIKHIGEKVIGGVMTALGLLALFFTLGLVGTLLAPPVATVAYNSNPRKIVIPGVSRAKIVSTSAKTKSEADCFFRKAIFKGYATSANGNKSTFQFSAYEGNVFVTNKHAFDDLKTPIRLKVADPGVTETISDHIIRSADLKFVPNSDYALFALPTMRPSKTMRNHWITELELEDKMINLRRTEMMIASINETTMDLATRESPDRIIEVGYGYKVSPCTDLAPIRQHNHRVLEFKENIVRGQSGSLALHSNDCLQNKITGTLERSFDTESHMIVSGTVHMSELGKNRAFVAVVSREELDAVYKQFDDKHLITVNLLEAPEIEHPLGEVFKHGQVIKASPFKKHSVPIASGFRRTPIFGHYPSEVEPSIQHAGDTRIPPGKPHHLTKALNKSAGINTIVLDLEEELFAYRYLKSIYGVYIPEVWESTVLTTTQAITGLRMPGSTSIDTTTIAGLPYMEQKGVRGKKPFIEFNVDTKTWQIQNIVFAEVQRYQEHYEMKAVPSNFKMEFRKQELVGLTKIYEDPKTRTVGCGNMIHLIVYCKVFKDFYTSVKNVWNNGGACPFANGFNGEIHCDALAKHLKHTDYVIDFDVKAWEEKVNQNIMNITTRVKIDILKESFKMRNIPWDARYEKWAYGLVVDYIHADVIYEDICYEKTSGLLSGHPGTFMENSEMHEIVFGVVMRNILKAKAPKYATIDFIIEHCRSIKAADDILVALSPLARQYIKPQDIVEGYRNLGFEITAPDKISKITAKHLTEVQFLKNGFSLSEGMYTIYPNESQIYQMLNWVRTGTSLSFDEQMRTNFGTAMRFAFWRGDEFYETLRDDLNSLCAKAGIHFHWTSSYSDMNSIITRDCEDQLNAFYSAVDLKRVDYDTHEID